MSKRAAPDNRSTRETILSKAEKAFARKGFDGARVEEIARESGVNQAMIYYYFKSKEELFNAVIEARLEDTRNFRSEMKRIRPAPEIMSRQYLEFMRAQKDFLKILMLETLTSPVRSHWIFRLMDLVATEPERAGQPVETEQRRLAWFYFTVMPVAVFTIFREQWSDYFQTNADTDNGDFVRDLKSCATVLRASQNQPR